MSAAPLTLHIATSNAGKLRDFEAASLVPLKIQIQPLPGLSQLPVPEEDADTFAGNAAIKAVAYSLHAPGQLVLADDSGLEVDALRGAPGVHSARYAQLMNFSASLADDPFTSNDAFNNDARNNACLLHELAKHPHASRTARYRCVLAVARDGRLIAVNDQPVYGNGSTEGVILHQPRGTGGFGYDPLFELPGGRTMAEIDLPTRLTVSHRTRALSDLLPRLFAALDSR